MSDRSMGGMERHQVVSCVECEDFEFEKKYTGSPGTRGEEEYEKMGFDSCPVCGGEIDREVIQ